MNDIDFIRNFQKITLTKICKIANTDRSNVVSGKASKEKINYVKRLIENEIAKLYLIEKS